MTEPILPDTKNPYFSHGLGFTGFCHNLQMGTPEAAGGQFHKGYEPRRLAAIKQQGENIHHAALHGLKTLGVLLAVAQQSGELPKGEVMNAGWLVEFLAEIAADASTFAANAGFTLEHGPLR